MSHRFLRIIFDNWHIKILSLISAILIVYFNTITTLENRVITVPLEVRLSEAYLPAHAIPSSVRVSLRGEGEEIVSILSEDIFAFVDLSPYDSAGAYPVSIQMERRGDAVQIEPLQITSDPAQLSIQIEERGSKEVPIVVDARGTLPIGYELTRTSVAPSVITISGPQSALERIEQISAGPINITNHTTTSTAEFTFDAPAPYVNFLAGNSVRVLFEITEVPIENVFSNVGVQIINLTPSFSAEYTLNESSVVLRSIPSTLNRLDNTNLFLVADARLIGAAGEYMISVVPQIPNEVENVEIVRYQPTIIPIRIVAQ